MTQLPIVGARHRAPADTILNNLPSGQALVLVREPENEHDSNAIMVCLPAGWQDDMPVTTLEDLKEQVSLVNEPFPSNEQYQVGYVPRGIAEQLASKMDEAISAEGIAEPVSATLAFDVTGRPVAEGPDDDEDEDLEELEEEEDEEQTGLDEDPI